MKNMFATLCGLLLAAAPAFADDHGVTVTGEGRVTAVPDAATVTVGVVTRNKDASLALKANNASVAALLASVKAHGVQDKDVQTSGFHLSQEYTYEEKKPPVPNGFSVSNHVTVTVRDLDKLGKVLNDVVGSGANSVHGVRFLCTTKDDFLDKARRAAIADARRKAELYAEGAGAKLGVVLKVNEHGGGYGDHRIRSFAAAPEAAGAVPTARGEHTFTVTVSATWSFEKK